MAIRGGAGVALALGLAACAGPKTLLLAGEGDHPTGSLAVLESNGHETVLDQPLSEARLRRSGAKVHTVSNVSSSRERLIGGLPPPPVSFTLYFLEGTTTLVPESQGLIAEIREAAKRPGAEIQVTGHTDTVGSDDDNDRLSQQRATEVMGALIALGFPKEQLSAVGRGERDLAVPTADNVSEPRNRRVEVIVR
jgi:outer membrane protein OmpA-like peptidoglycan-associated protein